MECPECSSKHVVKNGITSSSGKQNYLCTDCKRQFVENPEHYRIPHYKIKLIDRLLLEKIPLAGIARAVQISERWLQYYVNDKYINVSRQVIVDPKKKGKLTLECDEMWSFVGNKKNKQWIWLALDRDTREIVGVYVGSRDRTGAQGLWDSLPPVYRQCAVAYTDFWAAYGQVFPSNRHKAVGKETGQTSHIERLNNTLRQKISRLVRKTLSFSKKIENHIGAIWLFVHNYNVSLATP
jgi:IS1 family transposase/DNA-directed RNA polymerase subunit RPC12/RpoP